MDNSILVFYWQEIPIGKENATTYAELCANWGKNERQVRAILHELSSYDNGDNYVLVRSASGKGFYRTDDAETMRSYRNECLSKGKSIFAPVHKINRILNANMTQFSFENNLRVIREERGLTQRKVCHYMTDYDPNFDCVMLSKMENSICYPTPLQLLRLAEIYGVQPSELINTDLYP